MLLYNIILFCSLFKNLLIDISFIQLIKTHILSNLIIKRNYHV